MGPQVSVGEGSHPSRVKVHGPGVEKTGLKANEPTYFTVDCSEAGQGGCNGGRHPGNSSVGMGLVSLGQNPGPAPLVLDHHCQSCSIIPGSRVLHSGPISSGPGPASLLLHPCSYTPGPGPLSLLLVQDSCTCVPGPLSLILVHQPWSCPSSPVLIQSPAPCARFPSLVSPWGVGATDPATPTGDVSIGIKCAPGVVGPLEADIDFDIIKNDNDTFTVKYTAPGAGLYTIMVLFANQVRVLDCPTSPRVRPPLCGAAGAGPVTPWCPRVTVAWPWSPGDPLQPLPHQGGPIPRRHQGQSRGTWAQPDG